jgi:DNA-binding MarR family transcriptional regulator
MTSDSPHEVASPEVAVVLRQLARAHWRYTQRVAADAGLHPTVLAALHALHAGGDTPRHLQHALGMTSGTTTGVVDKLEERGLAERVRSTTDRRSVTVTLTPAGIDLVSSIEHDYSQLVNRTDAARRLRDVLSDINSITAAIEAATRDSIRKDGAAGRNVDDR